MGQSMTELRSDRSRPPSLRGDQTAPFMTRSIGNTGTQFFEFDDPGNPLRLLVGPPLPRFTLAYEMYGRMNADRSNVILLFHAMTGSQHAAGINTHVPGLDGRWTDEVHEGWWDGFIGPGKALDTRKFCVVCANYLGGCYGSTGPASINPETGPTLGAVLPRAADERHRRFADEAARPPRRAQAPRGGRRVDRRVPLPAHRHPLPGPRPHRDADRHRRRDHDLPADHQLRAGDRDRGRPQLPGRRLLRRPAPGPRPGPGAPHRAQDVRLARTPCRSGRAARSSARDRPTAGTR